MSTRKFEFDAVIKKHPTLNSGFIEFPYDVKKEFGKNRVKVIALLDNYTYRGSLVKMGAECHWLGITQQVRSSINKNPGDTVHVIIEEDAGERTVEVPEDLLELMEKEPGIMEYFNSLSYTNRKEYARWITEAKREETRQNRLTKAIEMLRSNRKTPD